jgi:hypothetical protein
VSILYIVKATVKKERITIITVKQNPQQLEFYGYALSIGLAPNTSKNLIISIKIFKIFCLRVWLCEWGLIFYNLSSSTIIGSILLYLRAKKVGWVQNIF